MGSVFRVGFFAAGLLCVFSAAVGMRIASNRKQRYGARVTFVAGLFFIGITLVTLSARQSTVAIMSGCVMAIVGLLVSALGQLQINRENARGRTANSN